MMSMQDKAGYWLSDEGQSELFRRIDIRVKKPSSGCGRERDPEPGRAPLRHVDGRRKCWPKDQPPSGRRAQVSVELEQVRGHGVRESVREASRRTH